MRTTHLRIGLLLPALLAPVVVPAQGDLGAAVLRCRALPEVMQRVACYDAIVVAPGAARPAAVAPPAAAAAARAAPAAPAAENFGFEGRTEAAMAFVESTLAEPVDGWRANQRLRLANGQVWQVSDDSQGFVPPGPRKVRVRRGALGAFYLEIDGVTRSPRVRRVE